MAIITSEFGPQQLAEAAFGYSKARNFLPRTPTEDDSRSQYTANDIIEQAVMNLAASDDNQSIVTKLSQSLFEAKVLNEENAAGNEVGKASGLLHKLIAGVLAPKFFKTIAKGAVRFLWVGTKTVLRAMTRFIVGPIMRFVGGIIIRTPLGALVAGGAALSYLMYRAFFDRNAPKKGFDGKGNYIGDGQSYIDPYEAAEIRSQGGYKYGGGRSGSSEGDSGDYDGAMFEGATILQGTGGLIDDVPLPGPGSGYQKYKDMIDVAGRMTGVDSNVLATYVAVESDFKNHARPGTSSAKGLMQFLKGTWKITVDKYGKKYGIDTRFAPTDERAAVLMGAEFLKENARAIKRSLGGRQANLVDLYMAHFLGAGGARQFFGLPKNAIAANHMSAAAAANRSVFYTRAGVARTVDGVYKEMTARLANRAKKYGIPMQVSGTVSIGAGKKPEPKIPDSTFSVDGSGNVTYNPLYLPKDDPKLLGKTTGPYSDIGRIRQNNSNQQVFKYKGRLVYTN